MAANNFEYRNRFMDQFEQAMPETLPADMEGKTAEEIYQIFRARVEVIVYNAAQKADKAQAYIDQIIEG